ncbi:transglutaminase 5, like [Chanos chanos]|uniref:protein-glutamine gamma-glutamyltransferase n=1 Tax=Chanos chanos TaxID=29144 RepID=A0A6J2VPV4_CHACN|nr:protein-glutamine gamma-glutamyltransferase 5-like [Chanos chanos]
MEDLRVQYFNLEQAQNHELHRTEGLSSQTLVVRRGQPFRLTLLFKGRPYNPSRDGVVLKVKLGRLYVELPVTSYRYSSKSRWVAYFQQDPYGSSLTTTVVMCAPVTAPVGMYHLQLLLFSQTSQHAYNVGEFALLCNPWCPADSVFMPNESEREEFVRNDFGLLYMGTPKNISARPWSFDQYESSILEICMKILQVSPQHLQDWRKDYLNRTSPIYISRVISAMINSQDDRGVLLGNWSEDYCNGVHPSEWTGSGDILKQWAGSNFNPVKYGQCWVFAAVMCTVMRTLGIPCRVITNFNSAHDTNGNLVIEEYYSETGQKLSVSRDSIWNFHVWVECWMNRPDLEVGFDGWQVLDPTPQERSGGLFRCGPAPVKAILDRRIDLVYDIPFVYAAVNADVQTIIVTQGQILRKHTDTERVGALICTKSVGSNGLDNITGNYKLVKIIKSYIYITLSLSLALSKGSSQGLSVSLHLYKVPAVGENISFSVTIANRSNALRTVKEHVNAQAKEYNHSPTDTFWEVHNMVQLAPFSETVLEHQIPYSQYMTLANENLVNLAVVVEDVATHERDLDYEEFNIASPQIQIEVDNEGAIVANREHVATVTFTNPFTMPIMGILTMAGAGLLENKVQSRILLLQPGATMETAVHFLPKMPGVKMLQARLALKNNPAVIHGYKTITVRPA